MRGRVIIGLLTSVLIGLSPVAEAVAEPPALIVRAEDDSVSLSGHLEVLPDPDGTLTLDDVVSGPAGASFQPIPGILARGFVPGATWVRVRLRSQAPGAMDRLLEMKPPYLNELRVYTPAGDGGAFTQTILGDSRPYADRPIPFPSFIVPLTLPPDHETTILIRIATVRTTTLSLRLWSPPAFMAHATLELAFLGGWFGIAAMIVIINLVFWLWLRDRVYGWYGLNVLALAAAYLPGSGMLFPLWPDHAHRVADWLVGTALCAALLFGALFTSALFELRRGYRKLRATLHALTAVGLIGVLFAVTGHYAAIGPFVQISAVLLFALALLLSLRLALSGHAPARMWLVAFSLPSVGSSLLLLRNAGILPMAEFSEHINLAGTLFHMLLMTISLAQRVKQAERDWREAQQAALVAARDAEEHAQAIAIGRTRQLTEAKGRLEEALVAERQAARDRAQFVDMISHEYRTPLSVISASLDVLNLRMENERVGGGRSDLERPLARMRRAVHRLIEIVDVGLQRARIDVDGLAATKEPVALAECLDDALSIVRSHYPDRFIDGIETGPAGIMLLADRPLLTTVFVNLLDNALKYSPDDAPVRVGVTMTPGMTDGMAGRWLRFTVTDQGMGIAEDDLPRVFGKFFRSQQAQSLPGTGIGLAIARRIVELHGGRLSLTSRIAEGTTVTVDIPAMTGGRDENGDERYDGA